MGVILKPKSCGRLLLSVKKRVSEVLSGDAVQRRTESPPNERADDRDRRPLAEVYTEGERPLQEDRRGEAEAVQSPSGTVACCKNGLFVEGAHFSRHVGYLTYLTYTFILPQSLSSQERNTYKEYNSQVRLILHCHG